MPKAYWIGIVDVKNHEEYKKYADIAGPALIKAGAKICKLYEIEFKCFKYISDYANDESSNDWIENCHKGAGEFLSLYPECK